MLSQEGVDISRIKAGETKRRNTRRNFVSNGAGIIHLKGYSETSVTDLLGDRFSSASFFNHFENKAGFGLTVLDETFAMAREARTSNGQVLDAKSTIELLHECMSLYPGIGNALTEQKARGVLPSSDLLPIAYSIVWTSVQSGQNALKIRQDLSTSDITDATINYIAAISSDITVSADQGIAQLSILLAGIETN